VLAAGHLVNEQLFFNEKPGFFVAADFVEVTGREDSTFWLIRNGRRYPIHMLMSMTVLNRGPNPVMLRAVALEMKSGSWFWPEWRSIPNVVMEGGRVVGGGAKGYYPFNFEHGVLFSNLTERVIAPYLPIKGWAFFQAPSFAVGSKWRFRLTSLEGEEWIEPLRRGPDGPLVNAGSFILINEQKVDISSIPVGSN